MGDLGATLIKELNCETAFTIGGIGISESVVVTWIMMAVVLVVSLIVTHGLKVEHPGRGQLLLENAVTWLQGIGEGILGEEGKGYAPYLTSVLMYLGVANLLGILGFKPPTKDLNVTAALALMSIVLIETAGIRVKGLKGWLKSFTEPIAIVTPINIMEVFIKPLSLCMRLFGNVLGAFVIMKLIEYILPVGLPVLFSAYFDIFDGLIQAYVFVFLTGLFIRNQSSNRREIENYKKETLLWVQSLQLEQVWQFLQAQEPELVSESPHLRRLRQSQDSRRQREKSQRFYC